ncbi:MAG: glycosyltransferase, exosortase A system-associated [Candidatus Accumulibacter sp.]|uniref:TIGR04063 family PEP-CTERM/XrtA system glycosyltransferase n=1 Tax=Accumulibacter sp. TaxID=2053492 RepID=UPI002584738E|nr:TIGR04063 family PEP-CTERM/XrtA system glycosyltransferase [Accumulibacter sp.]MCM8620675.1 glycosyltransferase, exosortase A system-associated [Accumulibacter sp.]
MNPRILHVLDHSIPLQSGYSFRTLSILREQRKLGWSTFHLTTPKHVIGRVAEEEIDGWHFFRTPAAAHSGLSAPGLREIALMRQIERRLLEVVSAVRPNIIHAHSPVLNAIPALWVGKRLGLPVAYEVRAFWEDAAVDHGTATEDSLRYRLSRRLETYALMRADHVFTICHGLCSDIVDRGIAAKKVTVIPNAVDVHSFEQGLEADVQLRSELGLSNALVLGFIGSFYSYEGLDLLIASLPRILIHRCNVRLLLVGGGPQESALKEQAAKLGLADRVIFTGRVPHREVNRYYDLIDVLVYPRHSMRLTELVTPLKPLEAMAQGRVFVASDVGGHRELLRHGETGLLFRAGDPDALAASVLDLIGQRNAWPALRQAGRRFVEQERTWQRSVENYISPYRKLLSMCVAP